jgi:hypothetical protein
MTGPVRLSLSGVWRRDAKAVLAGVAIQIMENRSFITHFKQTTP